MKTENTEPTFTPAEDVYEDYLDGSGMALVARAGVPMTYTRAKMLGLIGDDDIPRVDGVSVGGFQVVAAPVDSVPKHMAPDELRAMIDDTRRVFHSRKTQTLEPIDPAMIDTLRGVDVPPGDLAHDLAHPAAIVSEEVRDSAGAVVARAKRAKRAK